MKKLFYVIVFSISTSCFAQIPFITNITSHGIEYSLYDADTTLLAKDMLYVPSSWGLSIAEMRLELLAEVADIKNIDVAGLDSVVIPIGDGWNVVIDSTQIKDNAFNIHYRILDNNYVAAYDTVAAIGQVLIDTKSINNLIEFVVAVERAELIQDAQTYKTAIIFRRNMSQFIGTYIK
ncbi:MAG: hypothetical protein KAS32_04340 [Candidatus Peribacteraceae bacterium]|nr:hypothetical protein [Candidatus Peribacteraceae bacterium]